MESTGKLNRETIKYLGDGSHVPQPFYRRLFAAVQPPRVILLQISVILPRR